MLELDKKDQKNIIKALNSLVQPLKPVLNTIGHSLVQVYRLGFKQSVAPDGSKWAPIHHREGMPLILTGILRKSITHRATEELLEVGTNIEYGRHQHFGGKGTSTVPEHTRIISQAFGKPLPEPKAVTVKSHQRKNNIKARPFLGISPKQFDMIKRRLTQHYIKASGGNINA